MSETKKQHYVPQFYLRRFATDERLYAFDKTTGKSFGTNVRDVASDRFFYEVPELDEIVQQEQALERFFHPFEEAGAEAIKQIVKSVAEDTFHSISAQQRTDLALYLALQWLRTKETREFILQFHESIYKELFLRDIQKEHPEFGITRDMLKLEVLEEKKNGLHAVAILDEDFRLQVAAILSGHYWILLHNKTSELLLTSDHPVINHGTLDSASVSRRGLGSLGVEVVFPLSPELLLLLVERTAFPYAKDMDGSRQEMSKIENVIYYNSHQIRYSYRQVYSRVNDFALAESMLQETPELSNVNCSRIDTRPFGTADTNPG